jgi:hypothetical protein
MVEGEDLGWHLTNERYFEKLETNEQVSNNRHIETGEDFTILIRTNNLYDIIYQLWFAK